MTEADRNALEAEAQRLYESPTAWPLNISWADMDPDTQADWIAVARTARRIYQDSAA